MLSFDKHMGDFYPRPPGGGRPQREKWIEFMRNISIHALRVEGDVYTCPLLMCNHTISIHALRVEGDYKHFFNRFAEVKISIHALRVEGDNRLNERQKACKNFYPRPPGGGRQDDLSFVDTPTDFYPRPPGGGRHLRRAHTRACTTRFLSTPSGWRATFVILH